MVCRGTTRQKQISCERSFGVVATARPEVTGRVKHCLPPTSQGLPCFTTFCKLLTNLTLHRIINQSQINVMILGFSTHTKSSSLNARKDDTNELPKASWVQGRHSLGTASSCIEREYSATRHRAVALFTDRIQPIGVVSQQNLVAVLLADVLKLDTETKSKQIKGAVEYR